MASIPRPLVLASASQSRQALLKRLTLDFIVHPCDVDETPQENESAAGLTDRLALLKAQAAVPQYKTAWIIGSDQSAWVDNRFLTKPGNMEKASQQLLHCSGKQVVFHTSVCLLDASTDDYTKSVVTSTAQFRKLSPDEIERYLRADKPFHCAGSFKCESLGISLFDYLVSDDPTALMGLPMIKLCAMLRKAGYLLP